MYSDEILSFIYGLVNAGIKIWYVEDKLQLFVPETKKLSEEQAAFIRKHKLELIDALIANDVNTKHYDQLILKTHSKQVPLSFAQERLWFIQKYEEGTHAYHIPMLYRLKAGVDLRILEKSLHHVVKRHEVLCSIIHEDEDGNSVQSVQEVSDAQFKIVRRKLLSNNELTNAIDNEIDRIFDLGHEIPIRASLLECEGVEPILCIVIHHIAFDGWSMEIFIRDLESFYASYSHNPPPSLLNLPLQYKDFALWQRHHLKGEDLDRQLAFWKAKLTGYEILNLPLDRSRPQKINYSGGDYFFKIDAILSDKLRRMAQTLQVSLYSLLISAYFLVLRAFSNQDDIIVGTPIANRHYSCLKEIVGFFVNNIVLRARIRSDQTIEKFIQDIGKEVIEAQLHQDIPFDKIVSEVDQFKDPSRHPLFQVMFTVQSFGKHHEKESILEEYHDSLHYQVSYFDLTTFIDDSQGELQGQCNYATSLFNKETIERFVSVYQEVLSQFVEYKGKQKCVSEIRYRSEASYFHDFEKWNATEAYYPRDKTIPQLLEEQAEKTPDSIALVYDQVEYSYKELHEKSTQFAHYLKSMCQQPIETVIGVCMDRSESMIIAILGILKAGYAYVPIDPSYPSVRKEFVIEDTNTPLLVVDEKNAEMMCRLHKHTLVIDRKEVENAISKKPIISLDIELSPTSLIYVMYTSGTSGQPKGVMVEHQGIINLVYSLTKKYNLGARGEQEGILQLANFVFDVSIKQMMLALLNGFKLVLVPNHLWADEQAFYGYLNHHQVTHLGATPSLLEQYDYQEFQSVKRVAVGGEPLSQNFYEKVSKHKILYNTYGVTEASVTSLFNLTSIDNLTIGSPIENVTCYVLNSDLSPLPVGAIGELFIGGDGVARGYLNNEALSAEKFIPNPFQTKIEKNQGRNARLYRTGDLVRRLSTGNIEYLGRNDSQIKIRGHRVDLKEIEQAILSFEDVIQCVVITNNESASSCHIIAYYVSNKKIDEQDLKVFLQEKVPEYMVPSFFISIEEIPLTINGKIDVKALPYPSISEAKKYVTPTTPLERAIVMVWAEILNLPISEVGTENSFFELGGNSILAIKLVSKIHHILPSRSIPVAVVFSHRTIKEFCRYLEDEGGHNVTIPKSQVVQEEDQVLSFAQERLWFYEHYAPETSVYNIPMLFKIAEGTDLCLLEKALKAVIHRHEILRTLIRTRPDGKGYQLVREITDEQFSIPNNRFQTMKQFRRYFEDEAYHLFDLSVDFPIKISINKILDKAYLCVIAHHIAFDGWSVDIFINELDHFYHNKALQPLPIQYKDYARWQREYLSGEKFDALVHYWKSKLVDFEPLNLPTDHYRSQEIDYRGANCSLYLDESISKQLRKTAQQLDISLHNLLLGAYGIVLGAFAHQNELVIGVPFANRHFKELEQLIGFFVNSLPIKVSYQQSELIVDFLKKIEHEVLEVQEHQDMPLESIVDIVGAPRDLSRHPIFQAMFAVLEAHPMNESKDTILRTIDEDFSFDVAKLDLTLTVDLSHSQFHIVCNYAVSLFNDKTIKSFLKSFEEVVKQFAHPQQLEIKDLHFTRASEEGSDSNIVEHPTHKTVHKLFEEQVEKTPEDIALVSIDSKIKYTYLNAQANQVAHFLLEKCQIEQETLVSLFLDRDVDLISAVLGIFKAGGAYVPIDPSLPDERIAYMLSDSRAKVILTNTRYQQRLAKLIEQQEDSCRVVLIDSAETKKQISMLSTANPEKEFPSSTLAYVIYTSGTAGFPKGVMVEHAGIVNLKYELSNAYGLDERVPEGKKYPTKPKDFSSRVRNNKEVILQSSNYSFDPFVEQVILSLLNGHILLMMPDQLWLEQEPFYEFLNAHQVTHINAPPSLLKQYDFCRVPSLRRLVFGGEVLSSDCFSDSLENQGTQVINVYGPTEATIITTFNFVHGDDLCIGSPVANVTCYVLGQGGKVLPDGAIGELYIGGIGLARGYLYHHALTEEKFVPNLFQTTREKEKKINKRLYKTGDLVRRRHDGKLEYHGRMDSQVKIRGYRIELKDIEKAILSYKNVLQSIVVLSKQGLNDEHQYLVVYFVASKKVDVSQLKAYLSMKLPIYMVPTAYIQIDMFPMTNGKLNYRQLPCPIFTSSNRYRGPSNEVESQLCKIWADVLNTNRNKISVRDSFFNIGGNSIMSISLINYINTYFKTKLTVSDLFISETIEKLAQKVNHSRSNYQPIHAFSDKSSLPNLFLIHPGGCGCEVYAPLAKELQTTYSCYGVDSYHLNHEKKMETLKDLAMYYLHHINGVMKESKQSHYFLLGWSFGGQIALEIAALLEDKGIKHITVFLLDYVHHDQTIFEMRKKISPEQAENIHGQHLRAEGHNLDSIARMRKALTAEEALMQYPIGALLQDTQIILFKALQSGPTFGEEAIKEYNKYVLSLPKNNIELIVKDPTMIELVTIPEAHHLTILTNGMGVLVKKLSNQFHMERLLS